MRVPDSMSPYEQQETNLWRIRFEDQRVKMVLQEFRLLGYLPDLLADCESRCNERNLTFLSLYALFPTFPMIFGVFCRSRVAEHCSPAQMLRSFQDVFLYRNYLELYSRFQGEANGRPIGLVVPFDGYRGGVVVHNGDLGTRGTKVTYDVPNDVPPYRLTVEPYPTVIRYLARSGWTPETPLQTGAATQGPQHTRNFKITPWMIKQLGATPAAIVFAWLCTKLSSRDGLDRLLLSRLRESTIAVGVTQEGIASETGLPQRKVQRALTLLRRKGFIDVHCQKGQCYYSIDPDVLADVDES